ncbi:MAG TPA: acyl-CoA ligase (AMP-forming), exosortase A system-associated, partial [Chromatiales bacterium]|nr:acyl-CoA ligase (AMP-forming), exosortase A system-associated [Chromatiales bacterium]HEX22077.1 acyl-CoA ligase (AMP-forming), exosortase A system-associated [Chromatiales bacterium]
AVVLGIPHPTLGQAIVAVVSPASDTEVDSEAVLAHCKQKLPAFMVPAQVRVQQSLPRNPNGKIDRKHLACELQDMFEE